MIFFLFFGRSKKKNQAVMAQQQQLTIAEEQEILTTDWTPERLKALPLERVLRFSSHPRLAEALLVCHGRRPLIMKDGFDLYPHQIRVVKWMGSTESHSSSEHWRIQNWNAKGGIIHLAMGLGKSLIALVHILSSPRGPFPRSRGLQSGDGRVEARGGGEVSAARGSRPCALPA